MQTLQKILLMLTLLLIANGCAVSSRVVVIDRSSDWVKLGPDVKGHVSIYNVATGKWELQSKAALLPEGWTAGPGAK